MRIRSFNGNRFGLRSNVTNDVDSVLSKVPMSLVSSIKDLFAESPSVIDYIYIIPNGFLKMRLGLSSFDRVVSNLEDAACSPPLNINFSLYFVFNIQRLSPHFS